MANTAILSVRITGNGQDASRAFKKVQRDADKWAKHMDSVGRNAAKTVGKTMNRAASAVSNLGIAFAGLVAIAPVVGAAILAASGAMAGMAAIGGAAFAAVKLGMDGIKRAAETAKPALDALKAAVSSSIEQGMIPGFQSLSTLMGQIQPQMVGLASTIGTSFSSMMSGIQGQGTGAIQSIITNADSFIKGITPGLTNILLGLLSFANQGAEVMARFAPQISAFLSDIGKKLGSVTADQIVNAFTQVRDRAAEIWDVLQPIVSAFQTFAEHAQIIFYMAVAIKGLQIAILAVQAATVIWTAVQWALNSAFLANPMTWIVLGIVALIAVVVLIATKTTWFQTIWQVMCDAVTAAWNWVVNAVQVAWNWVVNAISVGINAIKAYFQTMWSFVTAVWDGIKTAAGAAWQWIQDKVMGVINAVKSTFESLRSAASSVWNAIKAGADGVRNAIQWVIDKVGALISKLGSLSFPSPPGWLTGLFDGGIGADFRAVPTGVDSFLRFLPNMPGMFAAPAPSLTAASTGNDGWVGGGRGASVMDVTNVNITVEGAMDPVAVGRQIGDLLSRYNVTVGTTASRRF